MEENKRDEISQKRVIQSSLFRRNSLQEKVKLLSSLKENSMIFNAQTNSIIFTEKENQNDKPPSIILLFILK